MIPVGSTAVREAIERFQPIAGLHGHIHESAGATRIGRTLCVNPGSDYHTGRIAGCLVNLDGDNARHQFVGRLNGVDTLLCMTPVARDVADPAGCRRRGATAPRGGRQGGLRLPPDRAWPSACTSGRPPPPSREIRDIDVVTGKRRQACQGLPRGAGLRPNRTFNAMHGARQCSSTTRLTAPARRVHHTFEMCHVLPVGEHLERDPCPCPLPICC